MSEVKGETTEQHWTTRSLDDLRYSVGADFLNQVNNAMSKKGITQSGIATAIGISRSAVSQLLDERGNNNFTLDTILKIGAAVGLKPAIVMYESNSNDDAPVFAEVFTHCWHELHRPADFWRWHRDNEPCELCPLPTTE